MRRVGLIPLGFFVVAAAGSPARAQVQLGGEAGLARLQQTGIPKSTAQTLGASVDALGPRSWIRASVLGAFVSENQWTGQALATASLFAPAQQRVRWELSGVATTFGESNTRSAFSAELMARAHAGNALLGGALGAGGGVRRADGGRQPVAHGQMIGWMSLSENRLIGELSVVRTRTERLTRLNETFGFTYADLSGSWRREQGGFSFGATAGARVTSTSILASGGWGSVDAAAWIAPRVALAAAMGRSLDDVVRGVPPLRYVSVSIRFSGQAHAPVFRSTPRAHPASGPQIVAGRERIEIRANGASRVELMADFTDWNPVELALVDGVWRLERSLSPGLHRIALRIDGGEWITPSNLPRATDELGGVVGLITIP